MLYINRYAWSTIVNCDVILENSSTIAYGLIIMIYV